MAFDNTSVEEYTKTYTSFSGADIVASFNGIVIGELQAITYSVSREKAPIYCLGSPEPRSFSRGKRGIAGTLVFTVFDRDALIEEFKRNNQLNKLQKFKANSSKHGYTPYNSVDEWDRIMSNTDDDPNGLANVTTTADLVDTQAEIAYADEILPFDITITFANEYGQRAVTTLYGVELLNEGSGYSIDTVTSEKAYTFIARRIGHMQKDTQGTGELSNSHKLTGAANAD